MKPNLNSVEAIKFWKRFIDDFLGIWRGTKLSLDKFVHQLNAETKKYGIEFPINEVHFGRAVHFLEISVYLHGDNIIPYSPYSKPTDAKRYLNPNNFHPKSVFNAIPFSQMLKTMRNSSKPDIATSQARISFKTFENSGYNPEKLLKVKEKGDQQGNSH